MKKYFIPEGKAEVQQQKEAQEINMQICIDRYAYPHPATRSWRTW